MLAFSADLRFVQVTKYKPKCTLVARKSTVDQSPDALTKPCEHLAKVL